MGEAEIGSTPDNPRGRPWNRPVTLPRVEWRFGHPGRRYQPTEWLTVDYAITGLEEERLRAFERTLFTVETTTGVSRLCYEIRWLDGTVRRMYA